MVFDDINERSLRRRAGTKWNYYPEDVLPAWVADMDFVVAEPIRAALRAAVEASDFGYPQSAEDAGLTRLFAERVAQRFGWQIDPADTLVLGDVVQGLYAALETLSGPDAGVVIQTPSYPPFLHAAAQTGRRARRCALVPRAEGYQIDFAALEASIDSGTEVVMLCNPHNPTGRVFAREELERIGALACQHDLTIVSDEIHADLILDDVRHQPIAAIDAEIAARTVTLMAPSKAFNIAGLRMAFAHFGSRELKQRFRRMPDHVRGGINALSIAAVTAAWRECQPWLDEILIQLRSNRELVTRFVRERWPQVGFFPPQATYLAWLDMRALELSPSPQAFMLAQARVALNDGPTFGAEGAGFVRLNFATSPALLEEILERMDAALCSR